jgi:hypothetical protein
MRTSILTSTNPSLSSPPPPPPPPPPPSPPPTVSAGRNRSGRLSAMECRSSLYIYVPQYRVVRKLKCSACVWGHVIAFACPFPTTGLAKCSSCGAPPSEVGAGAGGRRRWGVRRVRCPRDVAMRAVPAHVVLRPQVPARGVGERGVNTHSRLKRNGASAAGHTRQRLRVGALTSVRRWWW